MTDQAQKSGDNSVNIMVGSVTQTGLSYTDAKALFFDLFKANFPALQQTAKEVAEERAGELIGKYVDKLAQEHPQGLAAAKDPDMQYAILSAQRAYARNGKKELGDLLVDILVERTKRNSEELKRIVLNESIEVAHKLTEAQINAMTVCFICGYTINRGVGNIVMFYDYLKTYIKPFCVGLTRNRSDYQHLVYAGCGTISIGSKDLHDIMTGTYQAAFVKGFDKVEISSLGLTQDQESKLLIPCFRDPNKFQINAINEQAFDEAAKAVSLTDDQKNRLKSTNRRLLSKTEFLTELGGIDPVLSDMFDCWDHSDLKSLDLTSVGIAISIANIKKTTGITYRLDTWIK